MIAAIVAGLQTFNELLTAGIAVTAFSLLLYALTFNLRDRVARSFAMILACVTVVYVGEALGSSLSSPEEIEFWLKVRWVGITILPAAYFHASDALLATTGRPSRGRRRLVVRLSYVISLAFLAALPAGLLTGELAQVGPAPYLTPTPLSYLFTLYYAVMTIWTWVNFWRAYQRTFTGTSKRRLVYLIAGSTAPALGSYPYLLIFNGLAEQMPSLFWLSVVASNLLVTALLVLMAYALAFFGVAQPDRIVRSRLFRWLLRGPVTASTVLAVTTLVRRAGEAYGFQYTAAVPIFMVATVLTMQYLITLTAPALERWFLLRGEHGDLRQFEEMESRLLTTSDLRQFLEAILAAVCDRLQAPAAFIASMSGAGVDMVVTVGDRERLQEPLLPENPLEEVDNNDRQQELFTWGPYWLLPLFGATNGERELLGMMGVLKSADALLERDQTEALDILAERAATALLDRRLQTQIFNRLQDLAPNVDRIQRMRAAARYDGSGVLTAPDAPLEHDQVTAWTKDALTHYWGGPKLTENPLLRLQVVRQAIDNGESPANALRSILRHAIERVRPEGERRFTGEWILYNILEMKFMEGKKVREVALRLAMSEADFYRKQRIAIEEVGKIIIEMEQQASAGETVVPIEAHTNQSQ